MCTALFQFAHIIKTTVNEGHAEILSVVKSMYTYIHTYIHTYIA